MSNNNNKIEVLEKKGLELDELMEQLEGHKVKNELEQLVLEGRIAEIKTELNCIALWIAQLKNT